MTIQTVTTGCHEVLRLRPGVYLAVDRSGQEYLLHRSSSQQLGRLTETQRKVLRQLADCQDSAESPRAIPLARGRDPGIEEVDSLLHRLRLGGWLHITVVRDDRPAYTIEPHRKELSASSFSAAGRPGPVIWSSGSRRDQAETTRRRLLRTHQ